jgi:hypothetical protein
MFPNTDKPPIPTSMYFQIEVKLSSPAKGMIMYSVKSANINTVRMPHTYQITAG